MSARRAAAGCVLVAALTTLAACGKAEAPKVDAAAERAAATQRAKEGPLGTQVKALEDAKSLGADINKKAAEEIERVEK